MALSDITLKQLRSDVQSRLADVAPDKFSTEEINHWVNMSQFDVAQRLSAISNIWYGTTQTVTITASAGAVTTVALTSGYGADKIVRIVKLVLSDGTLVPFTEDNRIHSLKGNSNYDSSYFCNWFGENLYIFVGSSATALSSNSSTLYFIRKPDEMTTDAGTMDVPTEYYDLVVKSAMTKALSKMNNLAAKNQLDSEIAQKFNEIRALYSQEVQVEAIEEMPGVQTPRNR